MNRTTTSLTTTVCALAVLCLLAPLSGCFSPSYSTATRWRRVRMLIAPSAIAVLRPLRMGLAVLFAADTGRLRSGRSPRSGFASQAA